MSDLRVPDLNSTIIAGRLTRDPELKYTPNGKPVCTGALANTKYFKGRDGERREETTFADFECWGPMAEFVGERLKQGRPVIVEGSLATKQWEDRQTGQKRSKTFIRAQRIVPLDWEGDGQGGQRQAQQQSQPQNSGRPAPRPFEEPIPDDDIPF